MNTSLPQIHCLPFYRKRLCHINCAKATMNFHVCFYAQINMSMVHFGHFERTERIAGTPEVECCLVYCGRLKSFLSSLKTTELLKLVKRTLDILLLQPVPHSHIILTGNHKTSISIENCQKGYVGSFCRSNKYCRFHYVSYHLVPAPFSSILATHC